MKVDDYRITSDDNNITVTKVLRDDVGNIKVRQTPKGDFIENSKLIGYYQTLEKALQGVIKHHVFAGDKVIRTMVEYLKECQSMSEKCKKQLGGLK